MRFLQRKPSDLFALKEILFMWAFHRVMLWLESFKYLSMKHVLVFINDSFVSCYKNDMALFQIEFHVQIVCPFIKFMKIFLKRRALCLS